MTDLTIGIVSYNGKTLLADCLTSIYDSSPSCSFEILVVDNASTDETPEWLRKAYPQVHLIANQENLGIAVGNNQCLQAAHGRYVLLLNNDTVVLPGMLDKFVSFADQRPNAGAVGGKLINPDGSFQASYSDFPNLWTEFLHATRFWSLYDPYYPSHTETTGNREPRVVDWMSSACLLVRKAAADQIGGVDESYIMYSDETDLQYRLKRAGWLVYYLPEVTTIHFGGQSATHWRRRNLIYRGKLLFFKRNYSKFKTLALSIIFALSSCLKILLWITLLIIPSIRTRARNELASNRDVLMLSMGIES